MNANSSKLLSRFARLCSLSLAALALLGAPRPAHAMVWPSSGSWEFTFYDATGCEGNTWSASFSTGLKTVEDPDMRSDTDFNDKASAWSFCNNTTKTALVGIDLYTDSNYSGTHVSSGTLTVPSGQCINKNSITPDNAVSSFKVTVLLY